MECSRVNKYDATTPVPVGAMLHVAEVALHCRLMSCRTISLQLTEFIFPEKPSVDACMICMICMITARLLHDYCMIIA